MIARDSFAGGNAGAQLATRPADLAPAYITNPQWQGRGAFADLFFFNRLTSGSNVVVFDYARMWVGASDGIFSEADILRKSYPGGAGEIAGVHLRSTTGLSGNTDTGLDTIVFSLTRHDDLTAYLNWDQVQNGVTLQFDHNFDLVPWAYGETHRMRIEVLGRQLTLLLDGVRVWQTTLTAVTDFNDAGHFTAGLGMIRLPDCIESDYWACGMLTSPATTTAVVPDGVAGAVTTIVVTARDMNGNPTGNPGDVVTVTVSGANPAGALAVTDNGDGTYTAHYTPTAAGVDHVTITINSTGIPASPYTSTVAAAVLVAFVMTVPSSVVAGSSLPVTLTAKDAFGNTVTTFTGQVTLTADVALQVSPVVTAPFVAGVGAGVVIPTAAITSARVRGDVPGVTSYSNVFSVSGQWVAEGGAGGSWS